MLVKTSCNRILGLGTLKHMMIISIRKLCSFLQFRHISNRSFMCGYKALINVNTNLYSALGGTPSSYQLRFTIAAAKANHRSVSHQYEREPPSPRSTPWGAYRSASHFVQYT